ncbi:hypothetical protein PGT21_036397 [Puccinia graminis f. sp. tritici]|uniref:Uncharacterized protein n=1 Tax=Puccinia graminis f. sp. tritici TaxID=56615 RepID=A0A5B0P1A5_PUCGR|nr:hypothetical protein PGT21_036397 [Puccinia graminis f. sp. tritici]KAA1121451.1 hypothetical protein PGTUg99_026710 [Puccinia graminis f. sp. tritici]
MYCLRYFLLVLLFFPFPTAPPFLVFLFLISMTVEHRPCAYCSLLLSAILLSTCSWNLASVDVSPVYHPSDRDVQDQSSAGPGSSTLLSSILSFFKSNDPSKSLNPTTKRNHTGGFKSITPEKKAQEPHHRCWCYSNHGRLFEPVSSKKIKKEPENLDSQQHQEEEAEEGEAYQPLSHAQSTTTTTESHSQKLKTDIDDHDDGTNEEFELDQSIRKPRRPLKSLFSPLWKPLMTTTKLPSARASPSHKDPQVSTNTPSSPASIRPSSTSSSSRRPINNNTASPIKTYRSSFSRTPLIYSHLIHPFLELLKLKLPLPMIQRVLLIINYNLAELTQKFIGLKITQHILGSFDYKYKFEFIRDVINHYRSNLPYEIRVNQLFGIRIFLGTRA